MLLKITIYFLIAIGAMVFNAWFDKKQIQALLWPKHGVESTIYILLCIPLANGIFGITWFANALVLVTLAIRWIAFDIILNRFRELPYDYIGETSFIDKQLLKLPNAKVNQYIIKFGLLLLTIILLIILK
jgi:hypothetical protein